VLGFRIPGIDAVYCTVPGIHGISLPLAGNLEYDLRMEPAVPALKLPRWHSIVLIWLGIAVICTVQDMMVMQRGHMHLSQPRLFVTLIVSWLVWVLATPTVLRLGRRFPPVRLRPISTWAIHLGVCGAIGLLSAAWEALVEEVLNPLLKSPSAGPYHTLLLKTFYNELFLYLIVYTGLLASSYILDSRQRLVRQQIEAARLNEQFSKAQLDALRRQIEPHFLFNALHAVAGLVREKRNDAAVNMIAGLSDFLRRVVDTSGRHEVPLGEEVQFLQKYLDIQKVRFADRLQLSVDVPRELFAAQVPSLILQPLVENAIKHGISKRVSGGRVRIAALRADGWLTLRVYNDGPGLPADWDKSQSGIGIANLRGRLRAMFGEAYQFSLQNQADGVEVQVSVPFRENGS
jgi:two-component system LytT family sensor kinase